MTQRLYYTDSYLRDFEAIVVERAEEGRRIYLDRTAFYPTSGGQPFDTGQLGGIRVTDVVDEGERVAHLLAEPLLEERAVGQVDWTRRFDHMQQHTGQHVLSAILADTLGYTTVGVHFGRDTSTLDLDAGTLPADQVIQAEQRANEVVAENLPVEVTFEEAETAIGLRKGSARTGTLRVVNIRNLDRSACGGTHVRATGEIGAILIRKAERVRKGIRLEFLCGARAIRQARADYSLISRLAGELSAAPDELPRLIDALRTDVKDGASLRRELEARLDLYRARELYGAASPDPTGIRRVLLRQETGSLDQFRGVAQAVASMRSAIFVGVVASPPAVLLAASTDAGVDAAGVLKGLLGAVGGRGGGSTSLAQGVLPGPAQLEQVLLSLGVGQESRV